MGNIVAAYAALQHANAGLVEAESGVNKAKIQRAKGMAQDAFDALQSALMQDVKLDSAEDAKCRKDIASTGTSDPYVRLVDAKTEVGGSTEQLLTSGTVKGSL